MSGKNKIFQVGGRGRRVGGREQRGVVGGREVVGERGVVGGRGQGRRRGVVGERVGGGRRG